MSRRIQVLQHLLYPRSIRELAERMNCKHNTVESIVRRFCLRRIVTCVTPSVRQGRLFGLTARGRVLRALYHGRARAEPVTYRLTAYAWVQAGRYRRLVIRCLVAPMNAKQLRKRILRQYVRISPTHVHHTLRGLVVLGLVDRSPGLWELTAEGRVIDYVEALGREGGQIGSADWWLAPDTTGPGGSSR